MAMLVLGCAGAADDPPSAGPGTERLIGASPSLATGEVAIEYVAHACFRFQAPDGTSLVIDPYASRARLGYDFPSDLETETVLSTHPHYDHDGGTFIGRPLAWLTGKRILGDAGSYEVGAFRVMGVAGKHADPYGKEFGQKNTLFVIETGGLRIAHLGDTGPLIEESIAALGRVDVLMLPIDGEEHILSYAQVEAIRQALAPPILIPMHYRHPDLELDESRPEDLGPIDPWLAGQNNVRRVGSHRVVVTAESLPESPELWVLEHAPYVRAPEVR